MPKAQSPHAYYKWYLLPPTRCIREAKGYMILSERFPGKDFAAWHQSVVMGGSLPAKWPKTFVWEGSNSDALWDNMVVDSFYRVVSDDAAKVLQDLAPDEIKFLPISIKSPNGKISSGYNIVWLQKPLMCVDLDKTMHRPLRVVSGEIEIPHWDIEVILDRTLIGDRKVFRLANLPQTIVVRGDVVKAIEAAGLQGFDFSHRVKAQFPEEGYTPPKQFAALYVEWRARRGKPVKPGAVVAKSKDGKSAKSKKSGKATK